MSDRHEWESGGERFFALRPGGLGRHHLTDGGEEMTESLEAEIECALELAQSDWPGSCEDAVTVAHEYSAAAGGEILRLAARVKELEDEVEKELQGQVDISESGGRMYDKLSAKIGGMEAVVAPLLQAFLVWAKDWDRLKASDEEDPGRVSLIAWFPVEALRALAKEGE